VSTELERDVESGALGSVRELEDALEATSKAKTEAESRLREAGAEASRILADARASAESEAAERRELVLAAVDADVAEIHRRGEERSIDVRERAQESRESALDLALAYLVPNGTEPVV
jgi:hypothetical protein